MQKTPIIEGVHYTIIDGKIRPIVRGAQVDPADMGAPPAQPPTTAPPRQDTLTIPADPPAQQETQQPPRFFTQADIEKARQEEKDKLYGRLSQFESQVQTLAEREAERQREAEEARTRAAEEERLRQEAEMSAKDLLEKQRQEFDQRFAAIEAQREADRALFEKEREFQKVIDYRAQKLAENANDLMPELADLVTGNTIEEVDASIDFMKQKTSAILGQVLPAVTAPPAASRGVTVTAPPVGPLEQEGSTQQLSAQDIANMDMTEYAKQRERILGALGNRNRDRGLYG